MIKCDTAQLNEQLSEDILGWCMASPSGEQVRS